MPKEILTNILSQKSWSGETIILIKYALDKVMGIIEIALFEMIEISKGKTLNFQSFTNLPKLLTLWNIDFVLYDLVHEKFSLKIHEIRNLYSNKNLWELISSNSFILFNINKIHMIYILV